MTVREAIDHYLAELAERGRRPHTLRGYRSDLGAFASHLERAGSALDGPAVLDYLASLDGLAAGTRARQDSAIRGFLRWAGARGLAAADIADALPRPERSVAGGVARQCPPGADVAAALGQIPRQAEQDQLLFGLLARLGLRPGEALALRRGDFDDATGHLDVPGWGGLRRRVLVDDPVLRMRLVNRLRGTGHSERPLFTAPGRETPLRYQSVVQCWERYCAAAGVRVRLGDLRRLHASELLAGGVPEWAVRQRLGQRSGLLAGPPSGQGACDDVIRAWQARQAEDQRPAAGRGRARQRQPERQAYRSPRAG
jgi:integrase